MGFDDFSRVHPKGYTLDVASGSEVEVKKFEFFKHTMKFENHKLIGGNVNGQCAVWFFGNGNIIQLTKGGIFMVTVGSLNNMDVEKIGKIYSTAQGPNGSLIGVTEEFKVYRIDSLTKGWSSIFSSFEPHSRGKYHEWGFLLCATMFDDISLVAVTSGPKSRIMFFDLNTKLWREGPLVGSVKGRIGTCTMLDDSRHIFVKSNYINTVYDTMNGNQIDSYFESNELPDYMGDASIVKGDFGLVLVGGFTDKVFYLAKGSKKWILSKQTLGYKLFSTVACLV